MKHHPALRTRAFALVAALLRRFTPMLDGRAAVDAPSSDDGPTPRYRTPHALVRRNGVILVVAMAATFVLLRTALHASPDADFNVAGYNVHHLFTGLLLVAAGGVPLAIFRGSTRRLDASLVLFGAGLGMALDEWVYLIATDGSNASYLLPVSLWGGIGMVGLACLYAVGLVVLRVHAHRHRNT
jgi:hypothetical protein